MRGKNPETLIAFLKGWEKNEAVGAVAVHWLNHNSDDHTKKQPGVRSLLFHLCSFFVVCFHSVFCVKEEQPLRRTLFLGLYFHAIQTGRALRMLTSPYYLASTKDARKAFKKCLANKPTDPKLLDAASHDQCGVGHNRNIKTFVQPTHLDSIENIHWVKTRKPTIEVTEHGEKIDTWCHWPPTQDRWALHHYVTKSREDWDLKLGRQRVGGAKLTDLRWVEMHHVMPNISCPELAAYMP